MGDKATTDCFLVCPTKTSLVLTQEETMRKLLIYCFLLYLIDIFSVFMMLLMQELYVATSDYVDNWIGMNWEFDDSTTNLEVKGSTLKQSTADPDNISKGYTQATSSKVKTAPNYDSHSDEIIYSMGEIDIRWQVGSLSQGSADLLKYQDHRANGRQEKGRLWLLTGLNSERLWSGTGNNVDIDWDQGIMDLGDFDWSKPADDNQCKTFEKWSSNAVVLQMKSKQTIDLSDKTCIGFGVEYSSSEENNNSSGDETLVDPLYENFKREKKGYNSTESTSTHRSNIPPRANVFLLGCFELAIRNKVVNQEKTKTSQSAIDRNKVIIEDWVDSDDEETDVSESQKETAFNSENSETSFENRSPNSQNSVGQESRTKGLGNKGGKLCFVCYSPNHLIKDCNLHERTFKHTQTHKPKGTQGSRETRPVWNNIQRVNHSNFARNSRYPHQRRSFIPSAVLTRDGLISTARPKMTQTVPSKSTANVTYQGTARSRVPQAVLSQSTGRPYHPRMDNRRPRISSYSPSSRSSTTRTPHRPQRPKKVVKLIWVKKGSTVGSQAVLPQTVKKSAMISPEQTWKPKENYL
ncbi:hypothetical protein Tco_1262234, partial [Tanacetum coccineum]